MNILQILGQDLAASPALCPTPQQQEYRSRFRRQAEDLLKQQAKGRQLRNQQQRILVRWQRIQLRSAAAKGAA